DPLVIRDEYFLSLHPGEAGDHNAFAKMPCPTQAELEAGVEYYITAYYKPAYGIPVSGFASFECNVGMQCACPQGKGKAKTCSWQSDDPYTWVPCNSFPENVQYCDKTTSMKKGVSTVPVTAYRTAAILPECLPFGTRFKIFGSSNSQANSAVWEALDTGDPKVIGGRRVDLFVGEGQSAYEAATKTYGIVTLVVCPDNDPSKCPSAPPGGVSEEE
ncbi:MAG: hypothetical protein ABH846_01790, partial [Patescibacteria group bacterium]